MKHSSAIALSCVFGLVACGKSADAVDRSESFLEALVRGVLFENGEARDGDIPGPDAAASTVQLLSPEPVVSLLPGEASIMPLDVENPDEGNGVAATLLQFEGAGSHTRVPVGDNADPADAGGAGEALHVENAFSVTDDICANLCTRVFTTRLVFAVELADGAVSAQGSVEVELDCTETGDPARCEDGAGSGGAGGAGGSGGSGGSGEPDAGLDAAVIGDAGPSGDAGPPPQIGLLTPASVAAGTAATITIGGTGFLPGAVAFVDGAEAPTTYVSDIELEADVTSAITATAGSLAVYVKNVPDDASTHSNVLYLQVAAAAGAPVIFDYSPDNGVAGDTILIIASNLAGQALTIEDAAGSTLDPGTLGTISWPTAGTVDTVQVVLPSGIVTGPVTITTGLGSYKGKIFSVGLNLTRATGTVVTSSTEYNTTNWGRASGADNNLATSFFTANGDCATATTCTTVPWYQVTFASGETVERISMRGNREYESGYDFIRGTFEVLDASDGVLWRGTYDLPPPDRDLDIVLPSAVSGARAVKFTSLEDESTEPGFSELEVFGP